MALPRYTPGKPKATKPRAPHGGSQKTLTIRVKAHTRKHTPKPKSHTGGGAASVNPLDLPITPGSGITLRQAMGQANNAVTTRYGPQEEQYNRAIQANTQLGQALPGWYDQYIKQLQAYRDDAQNRMNATNAAMQNQANSLRTIDTQGAQQITGDQRPGYAVDASAGTTAANASTVRQALEAGIGAVLAAQGGAAFQQASNQANVVGPTQKLQAQVGNAQKGQQLLDEFKQLKGQEGAYAQQFIDSLTQDEAKNILAAQIAGGKDVLATNTLNERIRHNKASEKNTAASRKAQAKANGLKVNQYGYTAKQWASFTPAKRQQIMKQVKAEGRAPKSPGAEPKPVSGPGSISSSKEASYIDLIHQVESVIKSSNRSDHEMRVFLANGKNPLKKVIDTRIINIAFDLARRGGLSPANVRAAHDLGIHVNGHFKVLRQPKGAAGVVYKGLQNIVQDNS